MIRKWIAAIVVRAYPRARRRDRGAEMVGTLLERSDGSRRAFISDCASLVTAGLQERGSRARLALIAAVLLVATAAAVTLTIGGGSPTATPGNGRVPMSWLRADQRTVTLVSRHSSACQLRVNPRIGSRHLLDGAPETDLSSRFAVLRRPAPASLRVSAASVRQLHVDAQGIYIRYTREGVTDGITYYMLPAESVGINPMPARCYVQQLSAFERQAAGLPTDQRAQAISWERDLIKRRKGPNPGIVLVTTGGGSTGARYLTFDELRTDPWNDAGGGGGNNITKTALIVPDSVASVTARYAEQTYPGRVPHPVVVTRRVADNLAVFVFRGAWDPPSLTYRTATGAVLSSTLHG